MARGTAKKARPPNSRTSRGPYGSPKTSTSPPMPRYPTHWTGPNDHPSAATDIANDNPKINHPAILIVSEIGLGGGVFVPTRTWQCLGMERHRVNNPPYDRRNASRPISLSNGVDLSARHNRAGIPDR